MTTKLSFHLKPTQVLCYHLWSSLSKANFYYDLVKFYQGYGIKYFLCQLSVCITLTALFIFGNLLSLKNYLNTGQTNSYTTTIDHVLNQIPEFYYDGNSLLDNDQNDSPVFIKDLQGRNLAAFDIDHNLSANDRDKIPLIFGAKTLIINLTKKNRRDNIVFEYNKAFGKEAKIINKDSVKIAVKDYLSTGFSLFFVVVFAVFYNLFYAVIILVMQFLLILLINIITSSLSSKFSLETITKKFTKNFAEFSRLLFFSSGSILLVQILFSYLLPHQVFLVNFLHLWTGYLIYDNLSKNQS